MARPLRIEFPGAVYHVMSRGNARQPVFLDDSDRTLFLNLLLQVNHRYNWRCHAYCLMENHYHLLIETLDGTLSCGMRQLNGVYTQKFNRSHQRAGHLFQGRYKAILVDKENYLLELSRYIVLNPVRAGLCVIPTEWPWSSFQGISGLGATHPVLTVEWILSQFNVVAELARTEYQTFVKGGTDSLDPSLCVKGQLLLGNDEFVQKHRPYVYEKKQEKEIPRQQRHADRPELRELFKRAETFPVSVRDAMISRAVVDCGYSMRAVATFLGVHYSTISRILKNSGR